MKRKHDHEEHMDETWLIPYADLLTLLLALFIVLFAASATDEAKMSAMAEAFYEEYNGVLPDTAVGDPGIGGIAAGTELIPGGIDGGEDPSATEHAGATEPPNQGQGTQSEAYEQAVGELVSDLHEQLTSYVEMNGLQDEMSLEVKDDGLLITLTSDVWFSPGSADINGTQKEIAAEVSKMIANVQDESDLLLSVVISGHTDNVPMSNVEVYANNWQLSVARAVNFMEELMNTSTLQPSNFSARGFGEYEPIDTNDTEEGRQRNRRVEVMISPEAQSAN